MAPGPDKIPVRPSLVPRRAWLSETRSQTDHGNSIHDNTGLGIDLDDDGITPNDPNDVDSGRIICRTFNHQNAPWAQTRFAALNSAPGQTFTIQLYASPACDPSETARTDADWLDYGQHEWQWYALWALNPGSLTIGDHYDGNRLSW